MSKILFISFYKNEDNIMKKILKFGLVGILNTLITFISYAVFVTFGINYLIANCVSYFIGVINSYYWNKNWVFKSTSKDSTLILKFFAVNLIVLTFNTIVLFIFVDKLGIDKFISQIFSISVGMVINFFLNKIWTFNKQKES